jgi:hypothetical protein
MRGHMREDVVVKINHFHLLAGADSLRNTPQSLSASVRGYLSWQRWQLSLAASLQDGKKGLDYWLHLKLGAVFQGEMLGRFPSCL